MIRISGLIVVSHHKRRCVSMRSHVGVGVDSYSPVKTRQSIDIIGVGAPGRTRTATPVLTKPRILSGRLKKTKCATGLGFKKISPSKWSHSGLTPKRTMSNYALWGTRV